jgi:hypothetical protein
VRASNSTKQMFGGVMETTRWFGALMTLLACSCLAPTVSVAEEEKFIFETWGKQTVEAFRGSLAVPENRTAGQSRTISLHYVRLPATGAIVGPPIVYLSGGPGSSGIAAINYRYEMFIAMRQYGDVVALDQRGTGASNIVPRCKSTRVVPIVQPTSEEAFARYQREAFKACLGFWQREGVDLAGYNTIESARAGGDHQIQSRHARRASYGESLPGGSAEGGRSLRSTDRTKP